ncbi:KAP family NTPase [Clostridium bowmanii]|uniref:KAP family P-loop NTPase fold protein n=1 Tax=Clostridium bowmanii TaxID=132925 RepID=UPI001C0D6469|nr:P-loop NTPase fold protein [Clostridium bowmanii]MBU3190745.1 KAP family NTPase [Clostridium bowmanii]MCA1075009.1 KAP family NTPase [Clostridium bowmanii]
MGIFNNNLEIDIDNPFKNDKLHREVEVKNLTAIFDIVDNQMVLAVNSQWGTGKTSFLKMWNQYLINEGYKTIFFNAWENDYVEEPFIAFVDEIRESINDDNKIRGFIEKAKDVGLALVKQTPKMASKMIREKTGFDSEVIVSNDELAQMVSAKIENYKKDKNSVEKFKIELEKVANKQFEESNKPFVIFVDELDRCRPDYAISLLERIKHFFNGNNIIFVLGIDKEALSNAVRVIYGEQTDTNGYLTRFIDLEYRLKESNKEEYVKYLLSKYEFDKIFKNRNFTNTAVVEYGYNDFSKVVIQVVLGFKLSLRDIEKFVVEVYMILKANINEYVYPYALLILCAIKRIDRKLYNKIKFSQPSIGQIIDNLEKQNEGIIEWLEDRKTCMFKAYLIWLLNDSNEINRLKENVEKVEETQRNTDKDVRCLQNYERIGNGMGYWMDNEDEKRVRERIFVMVELYDNFTVIKGE